MNLLINAKRNKKKIMHSLNLTKEELNIIISSLDDISDIYKSALKNIDNSEIEDQKEYLNKVEILLQKLKEEKDEYSQS